MMIFDFNEIPAEGERWPQFARDFLVQLGFHIENPRFHDPEHPYDFIAVEQIQGRLNYEPFRWLVGCRHKTSTRTAVKETDESDVSERLLRSKADGFIGFYSTPTSPGLVQILSDLKSQSSIKDFRFFDSKLLESYLCTPGFGRIVSRYFPNSARNRGTIHIFEEQYLPLPCENCGKDLLDSLYSEDHKGVVVRLRRRKNEPDDMEIIANVYFACKGACDEQLQTRYCGGTNLSAAGWTNLSDLVMSPVYLERIVSLMDLLGKDEVAFSSQALEKEKLLIRALAQRALREPTEGELQHTKKLMFNG